MRTEFFVEYALHDTTALEDAQASSASNAAFANLQNLKRDIRAPKYGTLEHNFFVLDGSCEEFPDEPTDLAYFSALQSGADGTFAEEQSIKIQFSENHTSMGVTLRFLDDYPLEIEVRWHRLDGALKSKKRFHPDALLYFCRNQVTDYGRIEIVFLKTIPFRHVKLQDVKYGTTLVWGDDKIKSGSLVNDVDPTSDKIQTDKLTFSFVDAGDEFNSGNADGLHKLFQRNQYMVPFEVVDGKRITLGTFFLDSVSTTKNVSKMTAFDYKGKLSNVDFMGGRMYNGDLAGGVIAEIMEAAGIYDYVVDDAIAAFPLYGTLKIQTCQKALREILFAAGGIINTSRRTGVEIKKYDRFVTSKVGRSRKFSTTYDADRYVSDITVKYKTWVLDPNESQITTGTYNAGTHVIKLSSPACGMTASGGVILEQTPYYVVLDVQTAQEIVISGRKYIGTELAASASIEHIRGGELRSAKTFTGTLLNFESATSTAKRLLEYYQLQQIIRIKYLAGNEKGGDWTEIENTITGHASFAAAIESMSIDLAGGFIANARCRGYLKEATSFYYAGDELYASEGLESGVI